MPPSIEDLDAVLDQYEFLDILGQGGMGAVYQGRQKSMNRLVAIKILPKVEDVDELRFSERFQREARAMAQMAHPNIVTVYDFGQTDDGQLFFVMEYVDGTDLSHVIREGPLGQDRIFKWIEQICDALFYAHSKGVVHRDIKPANIMLTKEGNAKVADFGLAKLTGGGITDDLSRLTMTDVAMGTPDYVAPEALISGSEVDHRADIYALGVMIYEMLTGSVPRGAFLPPSKKAGVDVRFDEIVQKAMDPDPETRSQHVTDVSRSLSEILKNPEGTSPIQPRRQMALKTVQGSPVRSKEKAVEADNPPVTRSKVPLIAGLVSVALAALSVVGYLTWKNRPADESIPGPVAVAEPEKFMEPPPVPPPETPAINGSELAVTSPVPETLPSPEATPETLDMPADLPAGDGFLSIGGRDLAIIGGDWTADGNILKSAAAANEEIHPRIQYPAEIPENFELTVEFTRVNGGNDIAFNLPVGDTAVTLQLSSLSRYLGLSTVGDLPVEDAGNPTRIPFLLENDRSHRLVASVNNEGPSATIRASINDEPVLDWSGDRSRLRPRAEWVMPDPQKLGIGSTANARFDRVDIRPITPATVPAPPASDSPEEVGPPQFTFGGLSESPIGQRLKEVQPSAIARYQEEVIEPMTTLYRSYLAALKRHPEASSVAFQAEIERVESGQPVPSENPAGFPAELARLRSAYHNSIVAPKRSAADLLNKSEVVFTGLARNHPDEVSIHEIDKSRDALRPVYRHFGLEEPPEVSTWVDIFNGTDLKGWIDAGDSGEFKVVDGVIRTGGKGNPLFFVGDDPANPPGLQNFEFSVMVKTELQGNSGVFIHCPNPASSPNPNSYEVQIANENSDPRKSGSLWKIKDIDRMVAKDGEWFELRILVVGKRIQTFVDDKPVIDWTEPENWNPPPDKPNSRIGSGTVALQRNCVGKGVVSFKEIRLKDLGPRR